MANEGFVRGGAGAADLANAVVDACEQPNQFKPLYSDDEPIQDKIEAVAKRVYGASDVYFYPEAEKKLTQFTADGLDHLPVNVLMMGKGNTVSGAATLKLVNRQRMLDTIDSGSAPFNVNRVMRQQPGNA